VFVCLILELGGVGGVFSLLVWVTDIFICGRFLGGDWSIESILVA
jgi:hypothetical protein